MAAQEILTDLTTYKEEQGVTDLAKRALINAIKAPQMLQLKPLQSLPALATATEIKASVDALLSGSLTEAKSLFNLKFKAALDNKVSQEEFILKK